MLGICIFVFFFFFVSFEIFWKMISQRSKNDLWICGEHFCQSFWFTRRFSKTFFGTQIRWEVIRWPFEAWVVKLAHQSTAFYRIMSEQLKLNPIEYWTINVFWYQIHFQTYKRKVNGRSLEWFRGWYIGDGIFIWTFQIGWYVTQNSNKGLTLYTSSAGEKGKRVHLFWMPTFDLRVSL